MTPCEFTHCDRLAPDEPVAIRFPDKSLGNPYRVCRRCRLFFNLKFIGSGMCLVPASSSGRVAPSRLARAGRRGPSSSEVGAGAGDPALTELELRYAWGDR